MIPTFGTAGTRFIGLERACIGRMAATPLVCTSRPGAIAPTPMTKANGKGGIDVRVVRRRRMSGLKKSRPSCQIVGLFVYVIDTRIFEIIRVPIFWFR